MKLDYIAIGLTVAAFGFALVVALPPPSWPKMPVPLVQSGIVAGVFLFALGLGLAGVGAWPGLPRPRGPLGLMSLGLVALLSGGVWFLFSRSKAPDAFQSEVKRATTIASLADLGWTVKPGPKQDLFGIDNGPLPAMEQSGILFSRLTKPFQIQLQSVTNLAGMHYLWDARNCVDISVGAGEFTDVSELGGFRNLTNLTISQVPLNGTGTVDGSPLASLTELSTLVLSSTRIKDIDFVVRMKAVKTLYLGQTLISDVTPLSKLPNLEKLDVRGTNVTDLSPISRDLKLTELSIGGTQIPGLLSLAHSPLKKLTIIEQGPLNLSSVGVLTHLESLSIWGPEDAIDFSPLSGLANLKSLSVSGLGIRSVAAAYGIDSISSMTGLESLTLGNLNVRDLNFISGLHNLHELSLNTTPVSSLLPLKGLTALKKLSLVRLLVVDVTPLLSLPNLSEITIISTPARADVLAELSRRGVKVTTY